MAIERSFTGAFAWLLVINLVACVDDEPGKASGSGGRSSLVEADAGEPGFALGRELRLQLQDGVTRLVSLGSVSEVELGEDYQYAPDWDLAFHGLDIFTNGGASGRAYGAAFGPLPFAYFVVGEAADVPFLIRDQTGGALRDWYFYDGSTHGLYSRFHTFGVRSRGKQYRLQILSYYAEIAGAPISALYSLRYNEVSESDVGQMLLVEDLDASAGGVGANEDTPTSCLNLETAEVQRLSPDQAANSTAWDLCFRRDAVSVNGELGGPGDVSAVDLDSAKSADETLESVQALTPANTRENFDSVDYASLTDESLQYRGDRVLSAFSGAWVKSGSGVVTLPEDTSWLVVGADGRSRFLIAFRSIQPNAAGGFSVVVRVRKAQ